MGLSLLAHPLFGRELEARAYNNGVGASEQQDNSRVGLTFALPLGKQHSIKLAWANGVTARVGDKVNTYTIGYQFLWLDRQQAPRTPGRSEHDLQEAREQLLRREHRQGERQERQGDDDDQPDEGASPEGERDDRLHDAEAVREVGERLNVL